MAKKPLTKEQIKRITRQREGEFVKDTSADEIIKTVQESRNPLIDEESQREARNWQLLGHCEVGGKITPPPPFPKEM